MIIPSKDINSILYILSLFSFCLGIGKVIEIGTALFHAAMHAAGWIAGVYQVIKGSVLIHIFTVARWIKVVVDWINTVYGQIREIVLKLARGVLEEIYEHIKREWVERLWAKYEEFKKYYKDWRDFLDAKVSAIIAQLFPQIWKDFQTVVAMFYDVATIVGAISDTLAAEITKVAQKLEGFVYGKLNDIDKWIAKVRDTITDPFEKFFGTIDTFKHKHWDPLVKGVEGLKEHLKLILTKEGKPTSEFSWDSGSIWGEKLFDTIFERHIKGKKIVEIIPPEELELYREMGEVEEEIAKGTMGIFKDYIEEFEKYTLPLEEIIK